MTALADVLPMLGLRITSGPLELRGITDDLLPDLAALVVGGIHEPERMPFTFPWTDLPAADAPRAFAQYHWRTRADWSPERWELNLAVLHEGTLVGVQGLATRDFLVTRQGETGSWLGLPHQGRGIGTEMRRTICAFAFDHLGAERITSGYFADNPASGAVSRKVGYRPNGAEWVRRRPGERAECLHLVLEPQGLVRGEQPYEVEGAEAFRRSVGLDSD